MLEKNLISLLSILIFNSKQILSKHSAWGKVRGNPSRINPFLQSSWANLSLTAFSISFDNFVNTYRPNHLGIEIGKVLDYKKSQVIIKLNDDLNINDGIRIIGNNDTGCIVTIMYKNGNRISNAYKGDIISIPFKENLAIYVAYAGKKAYDYFKK